MFMDKQLMFSEDQAITATAVSTNVLDMGAPDAGKSELSIFAKVGTAFTAAGAATMTIEVQTATDAAFTTPIVLARSADVPKASLVAGYQPIMIDVPVGCQRFLRMNYVVSTGPMTAGTLTAGIVADRNTNP